MSLHTVTGRILNVTTRQLGTSLTAAASVGATLLSVDDCSAFEDDGTGGWVSVNGQVVQFDAVDDDASTIHLLTGLSAAADEGDPVYSWSTVYQQIDDEQTALVQVDGDADLADPVHADVADGVGILPDGLRGDAGETCTLTHISPGVWEITAVGGRPSSATAGAQGDLKFWDKDTFTADTGGDQAFLLTRVPEAGSVHLAIAGAPQASVDYSIDYAAQTVHVPDSLGLFAKDDVFDFKYAYRRYVANTFRDKVMALKPLWYFRFEEQPGAPKLYDETGHGYDGPLPPAGALQKPGFLAGSDHAAHFDGTWTTGPQDPANGGNGLCWTDNHTFAVLVGGPGCAAMAGDGDGTIIGAMWTVAAGHNWLYAAKEVANIGTSPAATHYVSFNFLVYNQQTQTYDRMDIAGPTLTPGKATMVIFTVNYGIGRVIMTTDDGGESMFFADQISRNQAHPVVMGDGNGRRFIGDMSEAAWWDRELSHGERMSLVDAWNKYKAAQV